MFLVEYLTSTREYSQLTSSQHIAQLRVDVFSVNLIETMNDARIIFWPFVILDILIIPEYSSSDNATKQILIYFTDPLLSVATAVQNMQFRIKMGQPQ